jgi:hypothetical protein
VPCSLDVTYVVSASCTYAFRKLKRTLGPINDVLDVLIGVLKVIQDGLTIRIEPRRRRRFAGLDWHAPRSVLNTCGHVPRQGILRLLTNATEHHTYYSRRW